MTKGFHLEATGGDNLTPASYHDCTCDLVAGGRYSAGPIPRAEVRTSEEEGGGAQEIGQVEGEGGVRDDGRGAWCDWDGPQMRQREAGRERRELEHVRRFVWTLLGCQGRLSS